MHIQPVSNGREFETALLIGTKTKENQTSPEGTRGTEIKKFHRPKYLPFSKSILMVKRNQMRGNRTYCPRTPFLKAMYNCIAPSLRRGRSKLRVFVSLGSSLDFYHGVDFFFEYEGEIVTVDVTVSQWKEHYKADVLITWEDIRHNDHYKKARIISQLLRARTKRLL